LDDRFLIAVTNFSQRKDDFNFQTFASAKTYFKMGKIRNFSTKTIQKDNILSEFRRTAAELHSFPQQQDSHFGNGGASPEISIIQYPLGMGLEKG